MFFVIPLTLCVVLCCACPCIYTAMEGSLSGRSKVAAVSPTVANTADLTQVLSGLQRSGDLNTVLQQQPQLVEGTAWPAGIMHSSIMLDFK